MPIATAKGDTFKLWLRSDQDIPDEQRPKFKFIFLTGRQQRKLAESLDEFRANWGNVQTIDRLFSILQEYIVGWENIVDPKTKVVISFNKEKLMDVLRFQEANELVYGIFGFVPELEILKNLESQLPIVTEKSVEVVTARSEKTKNV